MINLSETVIRRLYYLAILSFALGLFVPIIGEEGVYTISSIEMLYRHEYSIPLFYGTFYQRPPLYNWLMLPFIKLFGIAHTLIISRTISALATIGSSIIVLRLVKAVWQSSTLAYFAALTFLVTDALRYHGWIAYADPLFSFFVFASIAALYYAAHVEKSRWLLVSSLTLTAAFLTKALTAYIFYASSWLILWGMMPTYRRFLTRVAHLVLYGITFSFPLFWKIYTHQVTGNGMLHDILSRMSGPGFTLHMLFDYGHFFLETLLRLSPPLLLAIYYGVKYRNKQGSLSGDVQFFLAASVVNYLPYFLAPNHEGRYFLPLYPLISIYLAHLLWQVPKPNAIGLWYVISIVSKYLFILILPLYLAYEDADYAKLADAILAKTNAENLYVNDVLASGISTVYYLDIANANKMPFMMPPLNAHGWMLSATPGLPAQTFVFSLGRSGEQIYLIKI